MSELDPRVEQMIARLRQLPEPNAHGLTRLRSALRELSSAPGTGWLVLSPARAAAWAALLVLATSAAWLGVWQLASGRSPTAAAMRTPVQFVFVAEQAGQVSLVGDFNDWDPQATVLSRAAGGVWSVVVPLEPGRFTYSFVVDGKIWHADPEAPLTTHDFGRPSSVLYVAQTESMP